MQHVAAQLHAGHQGLDGIIRSTRQVVYWPGMEGDLHHRDTCTTCNTPSSSQAAGPLTLMSSPEYPFQLTVADLFQLDGQVYLPMLTGSQAGWRWHTPSRATSRKLSSVLRQYFYGCGAPESVSTDGGSTLTSEEMCNFFGKWGPRLSVTHRKRDSPPLTSRCQAGGKRQQ